MKLVGLTLAAVVLAPSLSAEDLPVDLQAKFIKILLSSTGQFGFGCTAPELKGKLEASGIAVAPGFKMAWASSEAEIKTLQAAGKLVLVPKLAWLKLGGSISLIEEDGKPSIHLNLANIKASGMTLSDTIMKLAKKE